MKVLGSRAQGVRLERMQASPRWVGDTFRNVHPMLPGLRDAGAPMPSLKDFVSGGQRRVPAQALPLSDPREIWRRRTSTGLRATWLGHSTVLIEIGGVRILTDPVWGSRASPVPFLGPKRFHAPPVALKQMPPLDLVMVSHDHYDHLDYPTIRALAATDVPFVTSLGVGAHLERWGVRADRITELDWWESHDVPGSSVRVTAAPSQHFSGRTFKTRNVTLWSSFTIRSDEHAVFFSGDTGLTTEFEDIRTRLGPFDLVMLEVGGWNGAWGDIHLGPENALKALNMLGGGAFLPVHWSTFNLAMHAWDWPAEVLLGLNESGATRLALPMLGEPIEPAWVDGRVDPWWRRVEGVTLPDVSPILAPND
jgi:L-ascorbate metabolism protein UlaG (beta-lactamase superfamily)